VREEPEDRGSWRGLGLASLLSGAAVGALAAAFRASLEVANRARDAFLADARLEYAGWVAAVAAGAAAAAVAAWLVRRFAPEATGSGIPHVEAVMHGDVPPASDRVLPVKFAGGVLSIGAGLALGREGPTVQMGAIAGRRIGFWLGLGHGDLRVMLACGAGAGLAAAFNAPVAGAAFVLEELLQRFEIRSAAASLGASGVAIAVSRALLGNRFDYAVEPLADAPFASLPLFVALGLAAGLAGALYNRAIVGALALSERFARWPVELRAAGIGAAVGLLGCVEPRLVGGGDPITQATLAGVLALPVVALWFGVRFGLGALSYAAATPGGLFAPLLVLGAQLGFLAAAASRLLAPSIAPPSAAFGLVGMASLFAAVVRAPLTGIVLVTEMTGCASLLMPMSLAAFAAIAVPSALGNPPIYDELRERMLLALRARRAPARRSTPGEGERRAGGRRGDTGRG
jgi:CIC family chloride channel protein